uniref:RGS domain-containing protein n=1 Tax=Angiostrongylus cantonensis TaxID=6313 RepID=A0A0K0DIE9_ANGCA
MSLMFLSYRHCYRHRFLLRVHEIESRASNFSMPPIEVFLQSSSRTERFNNPDDLLTFIISEQEMSQFVQLCSRRLDHEASIAIESRFECGPRYRFHIVDDIKTETIRNHFMFRENEWMFSSEKGRSALRNQTGKDRLAVVTLSRTQNYSSLEEVKNELGPFAIRFDPRRNSGLVRFPF